MGTPLDNPRVTLWTAWKAPMVAMLGEGHVSNDMSSTVAKTPYARMTVMGNPTADSNLDGDECATTLSVQCETFTSGQKAMSKAYDIDAVSHATMIALGFQRTFGPELVENEETNIKRIISRYSRVFTGDF